MSLSAKESGVTDEDLISAEDLLSRVGCYDPSDSGSLSSLIFCHKIILAALEACLDLRYHCFDGHTSTQCCHGVALFTHEIISNFPRSELEPLLMEGQHELKRLQMLSESESLDFASKWYVPRLIMDLAVLYVIALSSENDEHAGRRAAPLKLRSVAPLGRKVCNRISRRLQREISNRVANRYGHIVDNLPKTLSVAGIPIHEWGQYAREAHVRSDHEGRSYVSHLYAMQVVLGQLIHSRSRVVVLNNLMTAEGKPKGRYLAMLQGNGSDRLVPASFALNNPEDPVVVFSGCSYTDDDDVPSQMNRWIDRFDYLVLAGEVQCSQFPVVKLDPEFRSDPIVPREQKLCALIDQYRQTPGVSLRDSSLFCLFHVYTASLGQACQAALYGRDTLPGLPISGRLRDLHKKPPSGPIHFCA